VHSADVPPEGGRGFQPHWVITPGHRLGEKEVKRMRRGNVTWNGRGRDLRRLEVFHHCSIFPVPMKFIAWDNQGRGWAIYACPACKWRAGFARERGRVVLKFGT